MFTRDESIQLKISIILDFVYCDLFGICRLEIGILILCNLTTFDYFTNLL